MAGPIEASQSTKFTTLSFTMEAHRVPQINNSLSGVIWNRDVTGVNEAVAAQQAEMQAQAAQPDGSPKGGMEANTVGNGGAGRSR